MVRGNRELCPIVQDFFRYLDRAMANRQAAHNRQRAVNAFACMTTVGKREVQANMTPEQRAYIERAKAGDYWPDATK